MNITTRPFNGNTHILPTEVASSNKTQAISSSTTNIDTLMKRVQSSCQASPAQPLPPPAPPKFKLTPELTQGAESFTHQIDALVTGLEKNKNLSPDLMMTEFLKLNLVDPNNSIETHNLLTEAMSSLRQQSITESLAASERAQEMRQEAEQYASVAAVITGITSAISICGVFAISIQALLAVHSAMSAGVQQALNETIKAAVQQGIQKGIETAGQNASKEALRSAVSKCVEESLTQAAQQSMGQALETTGLNTAENITTELSKKVVRDFIKQLGKQALHTVQDEVIREATMTGVMAALDTSLFETLVGTMADAAAVQAVDKTVKGANQFKQDSLSLDAQNMGLLANKHKSHADRAQDSIENEQGIIQALVESRNQIVSKTMSMLQARAGVSNKINGQWAA